MKYKYTLKIEDVKEDATILEIYGQGVTRNTQNCLKAVRRSITSAIKEQLDHLSARENINIE